MAGTSNPQVVFAPPLVISAVLLIGLLAACGGAQVPPPAPPPANVVVNEPAPLSPPEDEHVYWVVYWDDLQVLTIYAGGGVLRSEEAGHPDDRFSGTCPFMTATSHYFEREAEMRTLIDSADSLDGFFELLASDPLYDVVEEYFEGGY